MDIAPSESTLYTLNVANAYSSNQAQTNLSVVIPLTPHYYRYSVHHEKGMPPFFPYTELGNEAVNSSNGNLFFSVPLINRPGRNGLGVDLTLAYNSKMWEIDSQGYSPLAAAR